MANLVPCILSPRYASYFVADQNDNIRYLAMTMLEQRTQGLEMCWVDDFQTIYGDFTMNLIPGKTYLVFMLTYFYVGKVRSANLGCIEFEPGAVWVADVGRLGNALRTGALAEGEVFPDELQINIAANSVAATVWRHKIPESDF